jgi:TonB family protein
MMMCLEESDLQGYLEEPEATALRRTVESHLAVCAGCRASFDRVAATHQRVSAWLSELATPEKGTAIDLPRAWSRVIARIDADIAAEADVHLKRLLTPADVEIPWYVSLYRSVHDAMRGENSPALEVTSRPVAVKEIWGLYARDPRSRYAAVLLHAALFSLLMFGITSPAVHEKIRQTVSLIDPSLKPYIPEQTKGGGGGGDRSVLPVSKGMLPKPAKRQFVPPMITQIEHPLLPVEPSLILPPDEKLPQLTAENWGDPLAKLGLPSNGSGIGLGMGTGSNGGIGPGKGVGFGPGDYGGIGGAVFRPGGAVSAPVVIYKVEPEFSEEARKAKYSGTVFVEIVVDTEGQVRNPHVVKSLGLGLDEKAVEAVSKWKFKPGMKGGAPVNVRALVQVDFHLL